MTKPFLRVQESEILLKEGILDYSWEPEKVEHREKEITTWVLSPKNPFVRIRSYLCWCSSIGRASDL